MDGRSGAADPAFGIHLNDHGFHSDDHIAKPLNWIEILGIMEQPRPVTLPDSYNAQYQAFRQAVSEVGSLADKYDIMKKVFPHIAGPLIAGSRFCSSRHQSLLNLADLTDGNIVRPRVEIYDGAEHNKLDREILTELRSFIKPLAAKIAPVVPNFFGVFKSSKLAGLVPEQVARYFGAIGARGVQKLRSFAMEDSETVYDGNAYTITATYHVGILAIYAHHPIQPLVRGDSEKYQMTLIQKITIDDSPEAFQRGVTVFRNAREWAMGKRDEFVDAANARRQTTAGTQTNVPSGTQTTASAQNTTTTSAPDS